MIEIPIELELSKEDRIHEKFTFGRAYEMTIRHDQHANAYEEEREMRMPSELEAYNMQY